MEVGTVYEYEWSRGPWVIVISYIPLAVIYIFVQSLSKT